MSDIKTTQQRVTAAALSGRLPILGEERIYTRYAPFLWTCTAFAAATWAFLIGGYLPYVGNTLVGSAGYAAGSILGMAIVAAAAALPSHRYGIETLDAAKSAFGVRGIGLPLVFLIVTLVGWTLVVMALTARGAGNVVQQLRGSDASASEAVVVSVGLLTIGLVWLLTAKGPWLFERLSNFLGPGQLVVTGLMLVILLVKFDGADLFSIKLPEDQWFTTDRRLGFIFAVEFGMASAFTWWPVMGGLSRLVRKRSHVVGPSVLGIALLGAAAISTVAALAGAAYGTADPTIWMIDLGGRVVGSLIVCFIMVSNIATMVIMMYLCGVSVQHIKFASSRRWELVIAILLVPAIPLAFHTEWLLSKVMTWLNYDGLIFTGISAVMIVDYFVLRRQRLDLIGLFSKSSSGPYWFWGGVNWVAIGVSIASVPAYLWLYDPVTMEARDQFSYLGAALPVVVVAAGLYWTGMKFITIPLGKGGYTTSKSSINTTQTYDRMERLDVGL